MLAGLTFGSKADLEQQHREQEQRERLARQEEKRRHRKEKAKKHSKKEKHIKKDRRKHEDSGGSDSEPSGSGPEDAWMQQQQQQQAADSDSPAGGQQQQKAASVQREDWMTVPMARSGVPQDAGATAAAAAAAKQKQQQAEQQAKSGGPDEFLVGGIRYMKPEQAAAAAAREEARKQAAEDAAAAAASGGRGGGGSGGSGPISAQAGVSWRVKALARAQQLAKEQGKGLNEVLTERWGSAAEIAKGLMDKAAEQQQQQRGAGGSGGHRGSSQQQRGRDGPVPHYLSEVRSERPSMMKPPSLAGGSSSSKLSWRRPGAGGGGSDRPAERGGGGGPDSSRRDEQPGQERERERDGDRAAAADADRERRSHHSSDRRGPDSSRGDHRDHRDSRPADRDSSRGDREAQRDRQRHDRDRDSREGARDRERGGGSGHQRRQQQQPPPEQQQQVVDALKAVAGSINTFSNDGSFMQQFQRAAQVDEGGADQQQQQRRRGSSGSPPRQRQQQQQQRSPADDGMDVEPAGQQQQQQQQQQPLEGPQSAPKIVAADGSAAGSNHSKADLLRQRLGGKAPPANRSAADALRARLGGKAPAAAGGSDDARPAAEVVHLPLVDAAGRAAPGAFGRESAAQTQRALEAAAGGRVAKRVQRYGADGTRERYFADDDSTDLQTLVKRAKHGDDGMADIDATMASNIAKRGRFKAADLDADDEYDFDAGVDLSERRKRGDVAQQQQRERQRQVSSFNRLQRLEDKCVLCFKSSARNQDLALAVGQGTYLSLLPRGRLVEGHCAIVTQEHTPSMRQVDDDTWNEVRNWQRCLLRMFAAAGKEVVFLETAVGLGGHRHHALMEAVPLDAAAFARAPLYFRKAMQEAESEWSQHASKAVIDTKAKGLRGSVPPNFPYLYVQFGLSAGYVHVIDDEARFDTSLGRQVLVGLLQLPAEVMHRRPAALEAGTVRREAAAFRKQFAPFF